VLTVLLIVLAPLAIVVLPFEMGVAVAAFTVAVLLVQEWRRAVAEQAAPPAPQDSRAPLVLTHAQRRRAGRSSDSS
jgi:Flp pilus assembly protein protease CpaA